jgi:hypothetical protein
MPSLVRSSTIERNREATIMPGHLNVRSVPGRLAAGAFILHAGTGKWNLPAERAAALHGMAAGAFPFLRRIPAGTFTKLLSASEVATGAVLLSPFVRDRLAGAALTAFSGGLLTMYWRTPTLRKAGSIWPTPAGLPISKDVWMLGIGLGLMAGDCCTPRPR